MSNNLTIRANSTKVVIEIDITEAAVKRAPLSSTGKTRLLASTGGAVPVECQVTGLKIAVNAMIPRQ